MRAETERIWSEHDRHPGDRPRLFTAVAGHVPAAAVLYPGSYIDVAPSCVYDEVTYVDTDPRAARFFDDVDGVEEIIAGLRRGGGRARWRFVHADYTTPLPIEYESIDLLISLYAGFVSDACGRYLKPGGVLLVNGSHGDAALAAVDPRFRPIGVVMAGGGTYRVVTDEPASFLEPVDPAALTRDAVLASGRGVRFTRRAFAYLFERIAGG